MTVPDDPAADEPDQAILPMVREKPAGWEPPIRKKPDQNRWDACKHKLLYVDIKKRSCSCRTCGAVVDPFDAVLTWMERDYALDYRVQAIEDHRKRESAKAERRRQRTSRKVT